MSRFWTLLPLIMLLGLPACGKDRSSEKGGSDPAQAEDEGWSVTAWSEHYELFAETDPLIAGREAPSHAHFTWLPDFSALNEGSVTGILRGPDGREESFLAPKPSRAGIFNVVFKPAREGTYELIFRVQNSKANEDIAAGRVRVGSAASPGKLVELPAGAPDEKTAAGEPVGFLKEQQWRTEFATEWAGEGVVKRALRTSGRVLPSGGALSGLVLIGMYGLLFFAFRNHRYALIVLVNLPLALVGGVFAVALGGGVLSVASLVGFITLFGIATRNGVLLVSHYQHLMQEEGLDLAQAVVQGSRERLAPVLMTALTAGLALIPLVLAGGEPGNEIQSPMAQVILGGLLSSTFLNLVLVPVLFARWGGAAAEEAVAGVRATTRVAPTGAAAG